MQVHSRGKIGLLSGLSALVIMAVAWASVPTAHAEPPGSEVALVAEKVKTSKLAPPLVGMDLANAQQFAKAVGVRIAFKDASKAKREVKYPEQWHVVSQALEPGARLKGKKISVRVLRHGEEVESISSMSANQVIEQSRSVMLNLVGLTLEEAHHRIDSEDLYSLDEIDGSGKARNPFLRSNWTVIAQDTPPGTTERGVKLTVKKNGETSKKDLQKTWVRDNWDVSSYFGKVTGYESDEYSGSRDENVVVVDQTPVELDLIAPFPNACYRPVEDGTSQAAKARELPIGTKVLVRYKAAWEEVGFIHALGTLDFADIPRNSANEALVLTGEWVPNHFGFNDSDVVSGETLVYVPRTDWSGYLTETEVPYALLILQAGNQVRANPVGGVVTCAAQSAAWQQKKREIEIQSREARREWELEYERRKALGWYSCRDGDGDGYCNE